MTLRERVWEDLAADLEYHPRRGLLYLALAAAAFAIWFYYPSGNETAVVPLVSGLGGLALLLKGIFLFRKSSEGLALSTQELDQLSDRANRKEFPPIPTLIAQIIQDFGTGSLILAPVLHSLRNANEPWEFPTAWVFFIGACLVAAGWSIRHLSESQTARH